MALSRSESPHTVFEVLKSDEKDRANFAPADSFQHCFYLSF